MDGFEASTYGDAFADTYDRWYGDLPGLEDTVAAAERLAGGRPVLELGCGTGRLCLPLARRGVVVHGLDSSDAMLERLREKDPSGQVITHRADMAAFTLDGAPRFGLAFLAFNSLFNLPSAEAQAGCFASAARHLLPGGRFALECVVPGDPPSRPKDAIDLHSIGVDRVVLRVSRQDPSNQTVTGQHVEITETGIRLRPWFLRYATVEELDTMAATAGFQLEDRWADWAATPFGPDAIAHVSVYRLAPTG
ncbi:MAG: class I SAM-dependent methyltransferase [Acidimicrobiia bacterium]